MYNFVSKSKSLFPDQYDYTKVKYETGSIPINLRCIQHDVTFTQLPRTHLVGHLGCIKCKQSRHKHNFIKAARVVHGDKYDYSNSNYVTHAEHIDIMCIYHKLTFNQTPAVHLSGSGCNLCGYTKISQANILSLQEFLDKAFIQHGSLYDYSRIVYKSAIDPVIIGCKSHGFFEQLAGPHLRGSGCKKCATELVRQIHLLDTQTFIDRSNIIHRNKYDYSGVIYTGGQVDVTIKCPKHGIFTQKPAYHLNGSGCHSCSSSKLELAIEDQLRALNVLFEMQWSIKCPDINTNRIRSFRIDFKLDIGNKMAVIEADGQQHHQFVPYFKRPIHETIYSDRCKNLYFRDNNISLLRISYKEIKDAFHWITTFISHIKTSPDTVFMVSNPALYNNQRQISEESQSNKRQKL